jgi:hypothetical protein
VGRAVTPLLARQGPLVPHQDVTIGAVEMKTRSSQAQLALYGQPPGSYRLRGFLAAFVHVSRRGQIWSLDAFESCSTGRHVD